MNYANHHGYTDVNPFEIIYHVSDKTIEIRAMDAEKNPNVKTSFQVGGFSAHSDNVQEWIITSNTLRPIIRIRKNVKGIWQDKNRNKYYLSNKPCKFYDYNF